MQNNDQMCEIVKNALGEILIIIGKKAGGPENPRFIFDGSDEALFYRSKDSSVHLMDISPEAANAIKDVNEILIVELDDNEEVAREYMVPLRLVSDIKNLLKKVIVA